MTCVSCGAEQDARTAAVTETVFPETYRAKVTIEVRAGATRASFCPTCELRVLTTAIGVLLVHLQATSAAEEATETA